MSKKNKLFESDMKPLQFARQGKNSLIKDSRNALFEKQRREYGFASCDFWNFDHMLLTLVRNCAVRLSDVGCYPIHVSSDDWAKQLSRVVILADDLLDDKRPHNKDFHNELMDWLKNNLYQMWY